MHAEDLRRLFRPWTFYLLRLDEQLRIPLKTLARATLALLVLPTLQFLGSWRDKTFFLPGEAKGLLEHPGQWAVFLAPPVLLILYAFAFRSLIVAVRDLKSFCVGNRIPRQVTLALDSQISTLQFRTRHAALLPFLSCLGLFITVRNFIQTSSPVRYYGNDIFDSAAHQWGFLFTRTSNSILYCIVFPALLFQILFLTNALFQILKSLRDSRALAVDFFSPDGCGGLSKLGKVNLFIMCMWATVFVVIYAHFVTHRETALTLSAALVCATLLFLAQSTVGVYAVHQSVRDTKREVLQRLGQHLRVSLETNKDLETVLPLVHLRQAVLSTSSFPYSKNVSAIVNSLRLLPPIVALLHLIL